MVSALHLALLTLVSAAVKLPLVKVPKQVHHAKRDSYQTAIEGNGLSFIAEIQVGTPPQPQNVILDTGSSDLWLATAGTCNTDSSGRAPDNVTPVKCDTTYDPNSSSSFVNTTNPFHITYGDLSESIGFYMQETLNLAGTTLDKANMAYSYNTSADSIMGVGFMKGEACVHWKLQADNSIALRNTSCTPYENVPQQLKTQGKISSSAYSIWLNDLSGPHGNILFGGVDHAKYRGQLVSLPIEAEPALYFKDGSPIPLFPKYTRTIVTLNQVDIYDGESSVETVMQGAIPALLDTGSTQCSLPSALIESLAQVFDARPDGQGGYFLDCGVSDNSYIGFNFRGVEIQVPLRQFIRPLQDWYGDVLIDADSGNQYCSLGASVGDADTFIILGDNVLSSLYSVYDLEAGVIALAPAIYNQDATDIEDITDSIPRAVEAPAYSQSFSSHLQINPSPTIRLTVTPTNSVYGQTGSVLVEEGLTATTAAAGYIKPTEGAVKPNIVRIGADDDGDDTSGMTDIIGEGPITQSQVDGINTVYTAGPPSTLGLPTTSATNTTQPSSAPTASSAAISTGSSLNSTSTPFSNTTSATGGPVSTGSSAASGSASGSAASGSTATITSQTTVLTTYCPGPTTFTYGGSTITVTSATTLTITSCPPESSATSHLQAQTTGEAVKPKPPVVEPKLETDTKTVTVLTTYCPEPTTLTYGGSVYTITEATTLTVTSCPPDAPKTESKVESKTESKAPEPTSKAPESKTSGPTSKAPEPTPESKKPEPTPETSGPTSVAEVPESSTGVVIANGATRNGLTAAMLIFALF